MTTEMTTSVVRFSKRVVSPRHRVFRRGRSSFKRGQPFCRRQVGLGDVMSAGRIGEFVDLMRRNMCLYRGFRDGCTHRSSSLDKPTGLAGQWHFFLSRKHSPLRKIGVAGTC